MRDYLDGAIAERKANPTDTVDVLNRCLTLQRAGQPGMDDTGIRNYMIGMLTGVIPTLNKSCCQIVDELLKRPDKLRAAEQAARLGSDEVFRAYLFEAFRFNPMNPMIYRRADTDTVVAPGTLRERRIQKGTMVLAANLSAMFDRQSVKAPNQFRLDRPWEDYILWGHGMHTCFGGYINFGVIPAMLRPLLAQGSLRRAPGAAGQIDSQDTPFPWHFHLQWG